MPAGRVLVVGTGAMATLFAARIARSRGPGAVSMAGTWPEALAAIRERGLRVEDETGHWTVPMSGAPLDQSLPSADVVLILVKSYQTAAVAAPAARASAPAGIVVTLQNGLGHGEILEAAAPGRVVLGVAIVGAALLAPAYVRAGPGHVILDQKPGLTQAIESLVALLGSSGFSAETTPAIEVALWRKLVANCAVNALSALHGVENGRLIEDAEARRSLEEAAREVGRVARARGLELGADPASLALEVVVRTAANRSSMLQDIDRGRPTEIEALNGAVVREGLRLGVPTPINEGLVRAIRERTAS